MEEQTISAEENPSARQPRHLAERAPRRNLAPAALAAFMVILLAVLVIRQLGMAERRPLSESAATTSTPAVVGLSVPAGPSVFGNLVKNWSFEQDLSGWRVLGTATASREPPGRTSGSCAAVRARGTAPGRVGLALPAVAQVARRDSRYVASAWVRSTSPGLQVTVQLTEAGAGSSATSRSVATTLPGDVWRRVTVAHRVTAASATLDLQVTAADVPPGEALLVDEVGVRLG